MKSYPNGTHTAGSQFAVLDCSALDKRIPVPESKQQGIY